MKKLSQISIVLFLLTLTSLGFSQHQEVQVIKKETLAQLVSQKDDTTRIINFWATWCRPCIAELPSFDSVYVQNTDPKVKMILVSLDDPEEKTGKVPALLARKNIKIPSLLLDEPDGNTWIDLVEPSWGGAIPATLVQNHETGLRVFHEGKMNQTELKALFTNHRY